MDEALLNRAKEVYNDLCAAIDARDWTYTKDEEKLLVHFGVSGDDLPMQFVMAVDAHRQSIRLLSPLPFDFPEDKRIEGAVAVCAATYPLADGSFDINIQNGTCWFRQTASYRESKIGEGLFQYMISYACVAVDAYNDRFEALAKGELSLQDFIASIGTK